MEDQQQRPPQETALGYELDTITLREIAAVRYVRHHEWLHYVLETSVPTSRITAPKIEAPIAESDLDARLTALKSELAELRAGEPNGWAEPGFDDKAKLLNAEIARLRDDFDPDAADTSLKNVEKALGKVVVAQERINPVPVTYERGDDAVMDVSS